MAADGNTGKEGQGATLAAGRWGRRALPLLGLLLALAPPAVSGGYALWVRRLRSPPAPTREEIAPGVVYRRLVRQKPLQTVHVVRVDLRTPGLVLVQSAAQADGSFSAQTPSAFLRAEGLVVAINGDFFTPWAARGPWAYYPYGGDPVGLLGRRARIVDRREKAVSLRHATFYFDDRGRAVGFRRPEGPCQELHGLPLIEAGRSRVERTPYLLHPRSALGLDADKRWLTLVAIDGRQPGHSAGASLRQLAALLLAEGVRDALLLDGGGSTALVARIGGEVRLLNRPIHARVVGWERPVANVFGVALSAGR